MRRYPFVLPRSLVAAAMLVASVGLAGPARVAAAGAPVASAEVSVVLDGHGNGHGFGLSQWGAYGYAVNQGWSSAQILDRYYGGSTAGTVPAGTRVRVRLQDHDGQQTAVSVESGSLVVAGFAPPTGVSWRSVLVRAGTVWVRPDLMRCPGAVADPVAAGWTQLATGLTQVEVATAADSAAVTDLAQLLALCEPSGTLSWYRGTIRSIWPDIARTVNDLPVEQYLRSVVAMEMSPGWAAAGGGKGAQALQAQAVAARSYALAQPKAWYDVCDQSCQAYYGVAYQPSGGSVRRVEAASTDAAVAATSGSVRRTAGGAIALTMFSAASGGHTDYNPHSLMKFPAVVDGGETPTTPYYNWSVTLTGAVLAAEYPTIGSFVGLTVLSRNGYGDWGGRVTSIKVVGSSGSVTRTGDQFKSDLGLRSNWFNPRTSAPAPDPCDGRNPPALADPVEPSSSRFTPTAPVRLIDTRDGTGTAALPLKAGCTMVVDPGLGPSVTAVAVNLTSVTPATSGFVTAYPCGVARPEASAIQALAGRTVAGMSVVPLGADGTLCIYSSVTTALVVDLFGSYATDTGDRYQPLTPRRLYDSRSGSRLAAGTVLRVRATGTGKAAVGASAVALTVHALDAAGSGFAAVYPCTPGVPSTSSVNVWKGSNVTNHVQVQLAGTGDVCVYLAASMHVVLDMSGWFGATATTEFHPLTPVRAVDTRRGVGLTGASTAGSNRAVTLSGTNGLPLATQAVVATVTAVTPMAAGYLTVHPCMSPVPSVSMVRFAAAANAAATVVGADDVSGRWCIASSTTTHVLVDVSGWFG